MRYLLNLSLVLAIVGGGSYIYYTAEAVCPAPIAYRIGTLDPQFELSEEAARAVISEAESLWEDATGRNLFTYDEDANFTINFIYDSRQQRTEEEERLNTELERRKQMSETVRAEYDALTEEYQKLAVTYESRKAAYESALAAHNAEVAEWNRRGGAPEEVYQDLAARRTNLASEQQALNDIGHELNQTVRSLNSLGEKGNVLVSTYNGFVNLYNKTLGTGREFTQGDYRGNLINIYQFGDVEELRLVLAHEMGHALSLGHVEGGSSIMYYQMGGQSFEDGLTQEDTAEFSRVCGTRSFSLWSAK